jgi:hypothetical protein
MINLFRRPAGFLFFGPFVLAVYFFSIFIGKEKSIRFVGPVITRAAKWSLRFFVPDIKNAADFDFFPAEMKKNFWIWRPFYDFSVIEENKDVFKLKVMNCPFCEAIMLSGLKELAPYVCQGDWEKARENSDRWEFRREHQIGTGDTFCDHTYLRKKNAL